MKSKALNKFLAIAVVMLMSFTLLSGCAKDSNASQKQTGKSGETSSTVKSSNENSIKTGDNEIVDQLGRKVKLPAKVNRVVMTSTLPMPSIFCIIDGSADKIVGMSPASMGAAKNSLLASIYPNITKASTSFMKGSNINLEEIANLKPDVILCVAGEQAALEKTGIPVVAFKPVGDYNSLETLYAWADIIGKILGKEDKAEFLKQKGYEMLGEVQSKIWNLPDKNKPSVMIIFSQTEKSINVSGSHFFGEFWIKSAGGRNVAESVSGSPEVTMEQIYKWDPDYIFITNFTSTQPEDLYNNKIAGQDWSKLKAVKNKKVYKIPLGTYRWFPPSPDSPLMIEWMAQILHPDIFNYYSIEEETKDYYKQFLNWNLTDEQINQVFHPSSEAANGYEK